MEKRRKLVSKGVQISLDIPEVSKALSSEPEKNQPVVPKKWNFYRPDMLISIDQILTELYSNPQRGFVKNMNIFDGWVGGEYSTITRNELLDTFSDDKCNQLSSRNWTMKLLLKKVNEEHDPNL